MGILISRSSTMAEGTPQPQPFDKSKAAPKFGHSMLEYFAIDKDYTNINNGSYGSAPKPVLDAANQYCAQAEANPDLFHRLSYIPILNSAREKVAKLVGVADVDEVVFVNNASHGVNTVLRNFIWEEGDVIVTCNTTYGAVARAAQYLHDVPRHPEISQFTILLPGNSHTKLIEDWRKHIRSLNETRNRVNPNGKIVAIIDAIVSNPGILLPWKEMSQVCKEENVWSLIDAAHAIGQEVNINLDKAAPDFWISNCHKWLSTKRSAAVFYVPKRNQHIIKTTFPTSHTYTSPEKRNGAYNFVDQFEWSGTIDWSNYLSVHAALDFREWIGGEEKINVYCRNLAIEGGRKLADTMGTELLDVTENQEFTLNMTNVALPISPQVPVTSEVDMKFKTKMLFDKKIFGVHFYHNGRWWARASAQVWLELSDFEKLGKAYLDVCAEIEKEVLIETGESEK
ncbi:PLP-dependent transferase [Marasmius fiardii PR-910]|nr:PLP-dependent transferase [Marasmius fiardii PR-910]